MKKTAVIALVLCLVLGCCSCAVTESGKAGNTEAPVSVSDSGQGENVTDTVPDNAPDDTPDNAPDDISDDISGSGDAFEVSCTHFEQGATVELNRLPASVSDLEAIALDDEYTAAVLIVAVLSLHETDSELCYEMLDYMMGPESISAYDKNFIAEQFRQYPYVARSYMDGAAPGNDYMVAPIVYTITENSHSREEDGYVKLFFQSGGADSPRGVTLRHKESTDQWFLFSDTYKGLLAGIRAPASDDKWS